MTAVAFGDVPLDGIFVESTWRKVRQTSNSEAQTTALSYSEADSQTATSVFQTTETTDREAQTQHFTPQVEAAFKIGDKWVYGEAKPTMASIMEHSAMEESIREDIVQVDHPMLDFLEKVTPDLLTLLELNNRSTAFEGFAVNWEEEATAVSVQHLLTPAVPCDAGLQVTGVAWNSNGTVVAISYGRIDVVGWCYDRGYVCTWNVLREGVRPTKPDRCFEVDNYVTCVAFHPDEPAILCGGTYNGEVIVWNIALEEDNVVAQTANTLSSHILLHTDPVHKVLWALNRREGKAKYVILSVSGDGRILIWNLNNALASPVGGYELASKRGALGCTCIGILHNMQSAVTVKTEAPTLESVVILGTETGGVCRAALKPAQIMEGASAKTTHVRITLADPVNFRYESHQGPVQQIHCSPFHRNLFLSASSDGTLKLFNVNDGGKLHAITPSASPGAYLYDAKWSPARPFVCAAVARDGQLYLFDLEDSGIKPVCAMPAGSEGAPVLALDFNPVNKELLATGDALGHVRIWKLSHALATLSQHEAAVLGAKKPDKRNELWFRYTGLVL
eukprot:GGOE01014350.1.p1 GENE.GGOE01014350.1~~GGOE01014350.1.p1  ORF type:complete len:562 (-),score=150.35 GGOE01014350.1:218-1903(-)